VRTYLELLALQRHLEGRREDLDAFMTMLETRRARYQERLPAVRDRLESLDVADLRARRDALAGRLERITAQEDALALATPEERRALGRLAAVERALEGVPEGPDADRIRHQHRVLRGVVLWRATTELSARQREAERALAELDAALAGLARRHDSLEGAQQAARARFAGFDTRIDALAGRIDALLPRVTDALEAQGRRITAMADEALVERQDAVTRRLAQARFALARLYDRASQQRPGG
ncbi:MAG: hypothetical protein R3263_02900, partial [Myxococcota bacterium]|nr:hypothetical protein [Myxococcota bacterium]